jgi:DNA polymerase III subunit delta'
MGFADILGHDRVKSLLSRALSLGRFPPSLLLVGPVGVGKRTTALVAAAALLCEKGGGDACGVCGPCSRVARGLHPDVTVVQTDGANIKIEQVRDLVQQIGSRPFEARARAFVVDEAHLLTEQAANALLKSLEEPAQASHVLLVSSAPQALLPTIRSRCQLLRFGPLPTATLERHLSTVCGLEPAEARLRAVLSDGSLGAALAFEAEGYRGVRDEVLRLLEGDPARGGLFKLECAQRLADLEDTQLALVALRSLLRDLAVARVQGPSEWFLNADVAERITALATSGLAARAIVLAEQAEEMRLALRGNANRLLSMDVLVDQV